MAGTRYQNDDQPGTHIITETQPMRDAARPVGAEPDVEERFRALQLTDERQQAILIGHASQFIDIERTLDEHTARMSGIDANVVENHRWLTAVTARLDALEELQPSGSDWKHRLQSRKFILAVATVVGSILTAVAGLIPPEWAAIITVVSGGIWTLSEAFVDNAAVKAKAEVAKAVASLRPPA